MAIVRMKRLRVIALARERDEMLARLLHAGCVELSEPQAELSDPEWTALLTRSESALTDVKQELVQVSAALQTLQKYAPAKGGLFVKRKAIKEQDFLSGKALELALQNAEEINRREKEISALLAQESRLAARRMALKPWAALDVDLGMTSTKYTKIAFAVCPAGVNMAALTAALTAAVPTAQVVEASADKEQHYFLYLCHRSEEESAAETLKEFGVSPAGLKEVTGSAIDNIAAVDREVEGLTARRTALQDEVYDYASCRQDLEICTDRLKQEVAKQAAAQRSLTDGTIVFFTGWVTEPGEEEAVRELGQFSCAWETVVPTEEEYPEVPVKLTDHPVTRPMNMVTEMYGLPAYNGVDPNPLMWPFFIFFFGFMFADLGYGLLMVAFGLIVQKLARPKGGTGYLIDLVIQCGISSAVVGFFTGGFFADAIATVAGLFGKAPPVIPFLTGTAENGGIRPVIDVMGDPMGVLILSLLIGGVQILAGMSIKAWMLIRDGKWQDALMDVGSWWLLFAGIGVGAVTMMNGAGFWWIAIAGVVALVATQGRNSPSVGGKIVGGLASLYDITGYFGDILSYSRLMVMMLAGTVIGQIFNLLGAMAGNIFVFIPIFLIGHIFNMGLNLIGTYVHTSRLQYLEYFGKFYQEGGRPFRPLTFETHYVDIIKEEQ